MSAKAKPRVKIVKLATLAKVKHPKGFKYPTWRPSGWVTHYNCDTGETTRYKLKARK